MSPREAEINFMELRTITDVLEVKQNTSQYRLNHYHFIVLERCNHYMHGVRSLVKKAAAAQRHRISNTSYPRLWLSNLYSFSLPMKAGLVDVFQAVLGDVSQPFISKPFNKKKRSKRENTEM